MGKFTKLHAVSQKEEKEEEVSDIEMAADSSSSDESEADDKEDQPKRESKWTNRERVLIFCSRGSDFRTRHLMNDLKSLMPHAKGESKLEKSAVMHEINDIASMKNCTKTIYFENRKHKDLYMWLANVGDGPSIKFLVHNVHTMQELKMTGNCLKASRPVLSFDSTFDVSPHHALIKQCIQQTFATPHHHPRSQPFIDHVFSFSITPDGRIWFRNFQIVDEACELQEIGPRFVLEVHKIFAGSFEGEVLYDNPDYKSPAVMRRIIKEEKEKKYASKKQAQEKLAAKKVKAEKIFEAKMEDPVGEIYDTERYLDDKDAVSILKKLDGAIKGGDDPIFAAVNEMSSSTRDTSSPMECGRASSSMAPVDDGGPFQSTVAIPVSLHLPTTSGIVTSPSCPSVMTSLVDAVVATSSSTSLSASMSTTTLDRYIKINVGGCLYQTTISTLTNADSMLRAMFSGRVPIVRDIDGWVMIDRSGRHFGLILDFLRDGSAPLPDCRVEVEQIMREAQYYLIQDLVMQCAMWLEAKKKFDAEIPVIPRVPIVDSKSHVHAIVNRSIKPVIKLHLNRHNNKYSYTTSSDEHCLKNLELFDRLVLKFADRILFIKDVGSESTEVCHWTFYGEKKKQAEVSCTSIVYATDKKQTKIEFPESKIYEESMSILRFEDRGLCIRCGGDSCQTPTSQ